MRTLAPCQVLLVPSHSNTPNVRTLARHTRYFLFLRILWRLLNAESSHDAGREEYEGTSQSETEDLTNGNNNEKSTKKSK